MIAYALRSAIILLLVFMIVFMICGVLYIKEHLARVPDSESSAGDMETDDPALSEPPMFQYSQPFPEKSQSPIGLFKTFCRSMNTPGPELS